MLQNYLWGALAKRRYLFIAAIVLLFAFLGSHEIWTQEHRWADIVFGMFYQHDFLHPSLDGIDYYDKPLLSYWFIAGFAKLFGQLTTWSLRLPSALAGLLAIFSIYRLGTLLKNKRFGLLAAWMLLTTYFFIFWARTSSADMLNMAGILFAVMWYFEKKNKPSFLNYTIFFLIVALTALCKGLVAPVVTILAIFPDLVVKNNWKKYLRVTFFLSMIPAIIIYILPFWASSHFNTNNYNESGLYLVYRENILRYFQPFDHKGPIYTYFIFLPVYLLPWTFFFIPALTTLFVRFKKMFWPSQWMVWATLILFLFFTLSGSRRSYYVLPIVPFAILMTADWIDENAKRLLWASRFVVIFFIVLFLNFDIMQPLYYSQNSLTAFSEDVEMKASKIKPWQDWQVVMLDAESKVRFYLQLPPTVKNLSLTGDRASQTTQTLLQAFPILKNKPKNTIFITRKVYLPMLETQFKNYDVVAGKQGFWQAFFKISEDNEPVAFIPKTGL